MPRFENPLGRKQLYQNTLRFLKSMERLPDRPAGFAYPNFNQVINRKVLHEPANPVNDFRVRSAFYTMRRDSQNRYYVDLIEFSFRDAIECICDDEDREFESPSEMLRQQLLYIYGLHYLEHPNLVQALRTFCDVEFGKYTIMTVSQISLRSLIEKVPTNHFAEEDNQNSFADFVVSCVLAAVLYLQNGGIVHNNITPETVFIDAHGHVRLAGFTDLSVSRNKDPKSVVADVYGAGMVFAYIRNTKLVENFEKLQGGPINWRTALNFPFVVLFPECRLPRDSGIGQIYSLIFREDNTPTVEQLRYLRFFLDGPEYAPAQEAAIVAELEAFKLRPKTFTVERPLLKKVAHKIFMSKPGSLTTPKSTLQNGLPLNCTIDYDVDGSDSETISISYTSGDEVTLLRGLLKFVDDKEHRHILDRFYQVLLIRSSISKLMDKISDDVRRQKLSQAIETRGRKIIVSLMLLLDSDNNETVKEETIYADLNDVD